LSKEIHAYIAKYYPDYAFTEAAQITYADGKPTYEAEITKEKIVLICFLTILSNMSKKIIFKNKQ
jgi:hypothetical protein